MPSTHAKWLALRIQLLAGKGIPVYRVALLIDEALQRWKEEEKEKCGNS